VNLKVSGLIVAQEVPRLVVAQHLQRRHDQPSRLVC
jgi:hypothetical protein